MKVILIGNGYWSKRLVKYIPNHFELIDIADSKTDLNLLLKDRDIEAVIIATPISTHYELTKKCLEYGKHVYVEKPITLYEEEALELKRLAEDNCLRLAVEYTQQFSKTTKLAVDLLSHLELEYIEMYTKHLGKFLEYDVYWLLASHHLSVLDMICPIKKMKFVFEDKITSTDNICTHGVVDFSNKLFSGKLEVSLNYPMKENRIVFYGKEWTIICNYVNQPSFRFVKYNYKYNTLQNLESYNSIVNYNEFNNLDYSLLYFKEVVEGMRLSNINTAIDITRILEKR